MELKLVWEQENCAGKCGVLMVLLQMVISVAKDESLDSHNSFSSSLPFSNVFQDSVGVGGGGVDDGMRMRMQKVTCLSKVLGGD